MSQAFDFQISEATQGLRDRIYSYADTFPTEMPCVEQDEFWTLAQSPDEAPLPATVIQLLGGDLDTDGDIKEFCDDASLVKISIFSAEPDAGSNRVPSQQNLGHLVKILRSDDFLSTPISYPGGQVKAVIAKSYEQDNSLQDYGISGWAVLCEMYTVSLPSNFSH